MPKKIVIKPAVQEWFIADTLFETWEAVRSEFVYDVLCCYALLTGNSAEQSQKSHKSLIFTDHLILVT